MFIAGHAPRHHFSQAAKSRLLAEIHGQDRATFKAAARPLVNHFGRPFLPIEKGVPMPKIKSVPTARPWAHMEIGDSFFEALGDLSSATLTQRLKWDAKPYAPRKFQIIELTHNDTRGLRVWRTA